ncbi:GNAT family N-acetyltransferase [Microbacterium sediminicola]|uniref:GNAT family N-acetyltransferase n=1 Tax=Microbacterium sediminicola TaxID=415210 RepID=UPI0031DEABFE
MIRLGRSEDVTAIRGVERSAGQAFTMIGLRAVAEDVPPSREELAGYIDAGRIWVTVNENGRPVAYILVRQVEKMAHIEQVSVAPEHARRGLGAALIDHVEEWARGQELNGLTLTTFAEVPWNAPYYERLGFRQIPPDALSDGLRVIREHEAAVGLDRWPRTAMFRAL